MLGFGFLFAGLEGARAQPLEEIGQRLGLSRERVRQLEQRALTRMRGTEARDALDTSMRGYQTATYGFLDLLDAERVLLELRLSERRARVDAAIAWAHIEMVVGDGITAAADAPSPEETSP